MKTFKSLEFAAGFSVAMIVAYFGLVFMTPSGAEIEVNTPDGIVRSSFMLIYLLAVANGFGYGTTLLAVKLFGSFRGGALLGAMLYLSIHVALFFANFGEAGTLMTYAISLSSGLLVGIIAQEVGLQKLRRN